MTGRWAARRRWRWLVAEAAGATTDGRGVVGWLRDLYRDHRRQVLFVMPILAGALGYFSAGPTACVVSIIYCGLLGVFLWRRSRMRAEAASRSDAVQMVAALAAQLRSGQAVGSALESVIRAGTTAAGSDAVTVTRRLASAVAVAESGGAPLANVLDRLDEHLRAVDRARAGATAQAAGTRMSAVLLAMLPAAGVGLGYVMGVDPLYVLLRTRLGALCLAGAITLQLAGLAWTTRLSRVDVPS
jgi:tight adherence protein B